MKIAFSGRQDLDVLMRRIGYGLIHDRHSGHYSYVRRMGIVHYPRFHVYIEGDTVNLHLDQKQASYESGPMHAGEYDGPTVEAEAERIKSLIAKEIARQADTYDNYSF